MKTKTFIGETTFPNYSGWLKHEVVNTNSFLTGSIISHHQVRPVTTQITENLKEIYPEIGQDSNLGTILKLLSESVNHLLDAKDNMVKGRLLESDSHIQHFSIKLIKLFLQMDMVDGFRMVINAINISLENMKGNILNLNQINTLIAVLNGLKKAPFLKEDQALDYIDKIESAKFQINTAIFNEVIDTLI